MKSKLVLGTILFVMVLLILCLLSNKRTIEPFTPNIVKSLTDDSEQAILFCKALRDIDQKTDATILLSKITRDIVSKGENTIQSLMDEIQKTQTDILGMDNDNKEMYNLQRHRDAKKQREILDSAKTLLKGENVEINLV